MKSKTPRTSKSTPAATERSGAGATKAAKAPKGAKAASRSARSERPPISGEAAAIAPAATGAYSASTAAVAAELGINLDDLAVGHHPPQNLSPQDETLFRAFQSNLLSLISHELRTPLMGVLNALTVLDENRDSPDFSSAELIHMARSNAQRLHRALVTLLDLAAIDSGTFHARLREVDLERLVRSRVGAHQSPLRERGVEAGVEVVGGERGLDPVLADPQKLGRALDLAIEAIIPRAEPRTRLDIRVSAAVVRFEFDLAAGAERAWEAAWSQSLAGFEGGVGSPTSAFGGVLQSEQAFLTRMEEGLGSEFILIHQILRLHRGQLDAKRQGRRVELLLRLAELDPEQRLHAVLTSRAFEVSTELSSVALALVAVPEGAGVDEFCGRVKKTLFRSSDAAYPLPARRQIALVLDDCKPEDAPRMLQRVEKALGTPLSFGTAHCPADGPDPAGLLDLASRRLGRG